MKSLKTPLRYPGGKSRACEKMGSYFPDLRNYDEFREPFLGGGSVAIYITKKYPSLNIWVNDLYEPLVNFWQQLQMFGFPPRRKSMTKMCLALSVLWLFMLLISALLVGSQRVHHFHNRQAYPTSVCAGLKSCLGILR